MAYSTDKKPGELTALTSLATDDVFVVGDTSDASEVAKYITKANLITDFGATFEPLKGADDNYVTDAEKTAVGTISGKLNIADIDDTPVNGETSAPISSNWAFDHEADTTTHGTTGAIVGTSDTQTLTNKRITKRTGTTTSSATPTINTNNVDFYSITAQTEAITSMTTNLSGTPTEGQTLWIAITGTGARAITWGASFEASTIALPTTTVSTNRLDVGFVWNTVTNKWRCVATC